MRGVLKLVAEEEARNLKYHFTVVGLKMRRTPRVEKCPLLLATMGMGTSVSQLQITEFC